MKKGLLFSAILLFLVSFFINRTNAQTTQASISGVISEKEKSPLPGATVQVRNESTGFTTGTVTNAKGEYAFKEIPLGGPYTIRVTFIGYGEQKRSGYMVNQGDAIRISLTMQEADQSLEVVQVVASGLKNKTDNLGAATAINAKTLISMPVNGRNFTQLVNLSPLTNSSGSLSGQLGSSTNYTIDGMTAKNPTSAGATTSRSGAPYSISIEAVREFKVITNQYDVVYGRAGGGLVSAVTKAGTNRLTGSVFNYTRANWLSSKYDIRGNVRNVPFSTNQFGFSLGGPIIKDKLHYFVVWDHQQDSRPLIIADVQTPLDESRFNVTNATLNRYVDIARSKYGVANTQQFGTFPKNRGTDAAFARIDWQINANNLLTIRDNYTNDRNKLGLADNTAINIYESYGNDYNIDNSLLATLRTTVSPKITNELKLQYLYTYQKSAPGDQLPAANIPRNIVENVTSTVDGKTLSTNIQMGGHRFAQEGFTNNVLQLVDNFYYNTDRVQYTFGADLMYTHAKSLYGSEVNGRFHFINDASGSALDNFNNLKPYRFYREVPLVADPTVYGNIYNLGAYGQLSTHLRPELEMTAGLRFDYSIYPKAQFNQVVFDDLKLRTDNQIKSFIAQPRIQFNWDVNNEHRTFIRMGAGVFASDINNYMLINNLTFDGKHFATVDVRGANVPTPDFAAYRQNASSIPTLTQFQVPTINMTGADAKIPVLYKANVSYSRFLTDRLKVGVSGYMSLGRNNYMYIDRNMVAEPFFRLANEANRGVYVPLASMPTTGVGDWQQGRISNRLGRVLELNSEGRVNQFAAVVDATWQYFRDGEITASYTWNDTRDNVTYNGNVANTATLVLPVKDDPRNLSNMTYSDNHFRNKVVVYGTLPSFFGVTLGFRYTGIGGTRYSLLSGANTNGDFVATNDLAFVFDRNNPEVAANVRTGLQALLDNPAASQSLKNYIEAYSGRIAERNGGINGFYGVLDIRALKRFRFGKNYALELSADVFNFTNLLKRDWGTNKSLGTQALYALSVPATSTTAALPGFNAAVPQYNYRVNNTGAVTPSGDPFQVQLGARFSFF
ncbi:MULTISPECIES: carboxypeptidase regulatory-like domain-containing protein [unclassified Spirosoma]|uniref:TonB-dependent receptor n=1 Tax=unclassified Spirosoma TaxID=2621999 RepID=UPI0009624496|nr:MULTISPECIES: carboxypeptidase regulatory-like domain-containing protein [unclassified Spirosoma]MBN8826249.1 TonB-dependent receptor [Spirosoma sp.]OJW75153.1 MAG: TonB-dependent receptor [Spirosoma sp. 48-14]